VARETRRARLPPRLDIVLVDDPASATVQMKKLRRGRDRFRVHRLAAETARRKTRCPRREVQRADVRISGFFIRLPLPKGWTRPLVSAIDPSKDVDEPLRHGDSPSDCRATCTPHGVIQLLGRGGVEVEAGRPSWSGG